jgi:Fucose permease
MQSTSNSRLKAAQRSVALICFAFFAAGLTVATVAPLLPLLATRLEVEISLLGSIFTTFSAGIIASQFLMSTAYQRMGQRTTLGLGLICMGSSYLAFVLSSSFLLLTFASLLAGFGFGGLLATGNRIVAQLFPERSTSLLNIINLFFGIGSIIGPALASAIDKSIGQPQVALVAGAISIILVGAIIPFGALEGSATPPTPSQPGPKRFKPSPSGILFGLVLLLYTGSEIGFASWLVVYLKQAVSMLESDGALLLSGFWIALTLGRAIAAALGIRVSIDRLLTISLLGMAAGSALLLLGIGNSLQTIVGVLLFGLSCGPVFPTVVAVVNTPAYSSSTASLVLAIGNGGGLILPAMLGVVLAEFGPFAQVAFILAAVILMLICKQQALQHHKQLNLARQQEASI